MAVALAVQECMPITLSIVLQLQPDRHSSLRELRQALRQAADGDRGDVWLRRGMRLWMGVCVGGICKQLYRTLMERYRHPTSPSCDDLTYSLPLLSPTSTLFHHHRLFKHLLQLPCRRLLGLMSLFCVQKKKIDQIQLRIFVTGFLLNILKKTELNVPLLKRIRSKMNCSDLLLKPESCR